MYNITLKAPIPNPPLPICSDPDIKPAHCVEIPFLQPRSGSGGSSRLKDWFLGYLPMWDVKGPQILY